jgi:Zn-dependent M16 (insulinase) family peptidase
MSAYSYRDPDPMNALAAFRGAGDYLEQAADIDLEQMIIGAIASTEPLLSPSAAIRIEDTRRFRGISYESRAKAREKILHMTAEDLRALAPVVREAMKKAAVCIVANQETINACAEENLQELKGL